MITKDGQATIGEKSDAWRALSDPATSRVIALHQEEAADDVLDSVGSADNVDYILVVDGGHGIQGRQDILDDMPDLLPKLEERKQAGARDNIPLRVRVILPGHISPRRAEKIRALADGVPA